jgi:hypothetical protein
LPLNPGGRARFPAGVSIKQCYNGADVSSARRLQRDYLFRFVACELARLTSSLHLNVPKWRNCDSTVTSHPLIPHSASALKSQRTSQPVPCDLAWKAHQVLAWYSRHFGSDFFPHALRCGV